MSATTPTLADRLDEIERFAHQLADEIFRLTQLLGAPTQLFGLPPVTEDKQGRRRTSCPLGSDCLIAPVPEGIDGDDPADVDPGLGAEFIALALTALLEIAVDSPTVDDRIRAAAEILDYDLRLGGR